MCCRSGIANSAACGVWWGVGAVDVSVIGWTILDSAPGGANLLTELLDMTRPFIKNLSILGKSRTFAQLASVQMHVDCMVIYGSNQDALGKPNV
jgi:hypothetical protein